MEFWRLVKIYGVTLPVLLVIDGVWLGIVARGFYREQLGDLMRPDVRWGAAVLFYLLFAAGLVLFVIHPALERQSLARALGMGAAFGLVTYAAYDLTNLAVLRGFPTTVAVVDLAWGCVFAAMVSGAVFGLAGAVR